MNTTLNYTGKVSIRIKNKPVRTYSNNGTIHLFRLISKILNRDYVHAESRGKLALDTPLYIDLVSMLDEDTMLYDNVSSESVLFTPMLIQTSDVTSDDTTCEVTYECLINKGNIKISRISETITTYAVLLDASLTNILAYVEIGNLSDTLSSISSAVENYQGVLTWALTIKNGGAN